MDDIVSDEDTIVVLERKVWDALVTGDQEADAALLADDFLGVYADGFAGKADHAGQLAHGPTVLSYQINEVQLKELGPTVKMLSYRADFQKVSEDIAEAMYVTSIWELRAGAWVNTFSQDTPA